MKLEEIIQKLHNVYPWSVDDVSDILGTKLTVGRATRYTTSYMSEQLIYEEGLVIKEVELRVKNERNETIRLILSLDDNSACFTRERIQIMYPHLFVTEEPHGHSLEEMTCFSTKQAWGRISFGFKEKRRNCLAAVIFIPKWGDNAE